MKTDTELLKEFYPEIDIESLSENDRKRLLETYAFAWYKLGIAIHDLGESIKQEANKVFNLKI